MYLATFVDILFDSIGDVEGTFRLDIAGVSTPSEGDAVHHVRRLRVHQFEFDMLLLTTYNLRCSVVVDISGAEDRFLVVRAVRRKLLQVVMQFLGDILEVDLFLNL